MKWEAGSGRGRDRATENDVEEDIIKFASACSGPDLRKRERPAERRAERGLREGSRRGGRPRTVDPNKRKSSRLSSRRRPRARVPIGNDE